jgi:CheY-like chemotaxis protein
VADIRVYGVCNSAKFYRIERNIELKYRLQPDAHTMTTILLVEDEVLLREGVQEMLEVHGYKVIGAGDGQEALEWLDQVTVNLIITDLVMPGMNGVDFVKTVREKFPQLPIIVASGSPGSVVRRLGIESIHVPGATASIGKPFKTADLIAMVQHSLAQTAA